ncbi:hypothetical protein CLU79DRAFT_553993 [Phycomyces nitens]|nr:hypothetical protein CLU79DRAFT_553993 [Phycomyces nitens]
MLLSDFPQEIIDKVIDILPTKDKISCCLVCKSWNNIFQDSLYSDITINSRDALDKVLNKSPDIQPNCQENGHRIQYMLINNYMDVTDEDIYALQKMFPNIKYICLYNMYINQKSLGLDVGWHPWRLLRELSISFWKIDIPDVGHKLVKALLSLPALRRLEIENHTTLIDSLSFSLNDIETIHSHLKHLGHLVLKSKLLPISDIAFTQIEDVSPATTMRNLRVVSEKTDNRWLYYFAHKYPNLRKIEVCTSNALSNPEEQRNSTMAILFKDHLVFQHLKNLDIRYTNYAGRSDRFLCEISDSKNTTFEHVAISINQMDDYSPNNLCDFPKRITEACLTKYSKKIKSFYLCCKSIHTVPIQLIEMENTLCNLVKLEINSPVFVELDTFLSSAPRLKSLELFYTTVQVKDELYTSKRFGLQAFRVNDAKITSKVLRFLSFHCRDLRELDLNRSSVYGNFTTPGCQFIDMTYSRIERFYIDSTAFIIQDNKNCPDNVNITLITRPVNYIPPKQEYDPNVLPNVIGTPTRLYYDWFYAPEPQKVHPISETQASRIMKFFSNYERNKRITLNRVYIKTSQPTINWENRCVCGYTKIKLGYIDNYLTWNTFKLAPRYLM